MRITGSGILTTQASPDTGSTINTYDSGGNLATRTDARGAAATYAYDALKSPNTHDLFRPDNHLYLRQWNQQYWATELRLGYLWQHQLDLYEPRPRRV